MMDSVLTLLLAGGKGTRLEPLTRDRAKPAVPFGGMYRIVDFALSNCLNSRLFNILVLTQYKSLSLEHHVAQGWGRFFHPEFGQWLTVASPQQRVSDDWYLGTANAVYQNLYSIEKSGAEHVLVLAADHVYKMDYRRMLDIPPRARRSRRRSATLRVPVAEAAGQFGVVEVDADARVTGFQEKPERPTPAPGRRRRTAWRRWGSTCSPPAFLIDELRRNAEGPTPGTTSATTSCPRLIGREPVRAFTFSGRGTGAPAYWRDVGTVDAYFRANMDLLADAPGLDLYDKAWPVYSFQPSFPPPRVAVVPEPPRPAGPGARGTTSSRTARCADGWLRGSVVGFDCRIDARRGGGGQHPVRPGACVGRGAEVRRAILDKGVQVRPGARVGFDPDEDRRQGFVVSEGGVTCVPKDTVVEAASKSA